jgi:hypothetical protein
LKFNVLWVELRNSTQSWGLLFLRGFGCAQNFTLERGGLLIDESEDFFPHVAHLARGCRQPDGVNQVFQFGFENRHFTPEIGFMQEFILFLLDVRLEQIFELILNLIVRITGVRLTEGAGSANFT